MDGKLINLALGTQNADVRVINGDGIPQERRVDRGNVLHWYSSERQERENKQP